MRRAVRRLLPARRSDQLLAPPTGTPADPGVDVIAAGQRHTYELDNRTTVVVSNVRLYDFPDGAVRPRVVVAQATVVEIDNRSTAVVSNARTYTFGD